MDVGKQLSVEASGLAQLNQTNNADQKTSAFLIVEGRSPIRLDIFNALRRRFPGVALEKLYPSSVNELQSIEWNHFDLVLISCPSCIDQRLSWLNTIKQRKQGGHAGVNSQGPLVVVLTDTREAGREAIWEGADLHLQYDVSATEFAFQLDAALEVDRLYRQYPLSLPEWYLYEAVNDSDNAVIFLAENQRNERAVVKRFKFDMSDVPAVVLQRFMADAATLVQHKDNPGLVTLLDAGVRDDALYMVMEHVDGVTLKHMLDGYETIDAEQRLAWFAQITQSLAQIHEFGLLHRDLKSSNIMMRADGSPVLLDFGVENKLLLDCGFLQDNEIYCTPFYVSPERIVGEPASVQSDLYALGILFYELLTGEKPFLGSELAEVLQHHVFSPVPALPDKFSAYQPLLSAMLAKSPEGRIKSADVVLDWLDELAG